MTDRRAGELRFDWYKPENVDRLLKLRALGHSATVIARMMGGGLTRNSVIGKLTRLGQVELGKRLPAAPGSVPKAKAVNPKSPRPKPEPKPAAVPVGTKIAAGWNGGSGIKQPSYEVIDIQPLAPPLNVSLLALGRGQCKWPTNNGGAEAFTFCGLPAAEGPYCPGHARGAGNRQAKHTGKELERSVRRFL